MSTPTQPDRSGRRATGSAGLLFAAVALTVAVRAAVLVALPQPFAADPDAYRAIAETLAETGVFGLAGGEGAPRPTAFRPPLYPAILSLLVRGGTLPATAVAALHVFFAALTAALVFATARVLLGRGDPGLGQASAARFAFAAALLTAIDPILLRQSAEVMTETLATTLTAGAMYGWSVWRPTATRRDGLLIPLALGTILALAYLCRPTFVVWAGLLVIATAVRFGGRGGLQRAACMALVVSLAVAGWTLRNARALGDPIWATTHGGYTLLLANNDSFYDYLRSGKWGRAWDATQFLNAYRHRHEGDPTTAAFWSRRWNDDPPVIAEADERADDRLAYRAALATIGRRPADFLGSALIRVGRLWSPLPHHVDGRSWLAVTAVAGFYLLIGGAIVLALVRHRTRLLASPWWSIWLLAVTLSVVHAVYWSNLRMRAPIMPGLMIMAVTALARPASSRERHTSPNSNALR